MPPPSSDEGLEAPLADRQFCTVFGRVDKELGFGSKQHEFDSRSADLLWGVLTRPGGRMVLKCCFPCGGKRVFEKSALKLQSNDNY